MDFFISNFVDNITKKYATFSGRASRKEYWLFNLAYVSIICVLVLIEMLTVGSDIAATVFQVVTLIPAVAVTIRRMHDTAHSGWWQLVPIVNLVFACTKGTAGNNRFGADPLVTQQ